ncbi:MAG: hypothetical protein KDB18_05375 [Salinibacterium sp.]|nr:hypothetical protein [Micrococcales bacterium]MBX3079195.1 hypothetical protein [Cryobacterium sp.]MCB1280934.1 hypothetical protein [Salinibacterium sp.]
MTSYPTPAFTRPAFAPGILGVIVLLAGLALLDNAGGYFWIKMVVAILAAIVAVFAWQARAPWWLLAMVPIVIAWNPVWPFDFHGQWWVASQFAAALAFLAAGIFIKVKNPADRNKR